MDHRTSGRQLALLRSLLANEPSLHLDERTLRVHDVITNKTLDGRNLLHLERYLVGKPRRTATLARLACSSPFSPVDSLFESPIITSIAVPAEVAERLVPIAESLLLHLRIERLTGVHMNSVGSAVAALPVNLDADTLAQLKSIVTAGNAARHAPFGGEKGFEQAPAPRAEEQASPPKDEEEPKVAELAPWSSRPWRRGALADTAAAADVARQASPPKAKEEPNLAEQAWLPNAEEQPV